MTANTAFGVDAAMIPLFRRMEQRDALGQAEKAAMIAAIGERLTFPAGADLASEGDHPGRSILLVSGFTSRYRLTPTGQRQITALQVPGDLVDLQSFLLKEMDHSVGALSNCHAISFDHTALVAITKDFPHLTRLLWLMTLLDGAIMREWLVGIGRLTAGERMAHLLCELCTRLESVGLATGRSFDLPIRQADLADALGLSHVHANRVLQSLRARNLLTWQGSTVAILDWDGLRTYGAFEDAYLHLTSEPR